MMDIAEEIRFGWCVLSVRGRADAAAAEQLEAKLGSTVAANDRVAVNLSAVDYISSCGIRALLQAARAAQARNARFTLCSPSAQVKKVFEISKLHQVLEIHEELPC